MVSDILFPFIEGGVPLSSILAYQDGTHLSTSAVAFELLTKIRYYDILDTIVMLISYTERLKQ